MAPLDAHHQFHLAESFITAGAANRGLDLLEQSVHGFHPYLYLSEFCRFLDPVRQTPRFRAYLATAKQNTEMFSSARPSSKGEDCRLHGCGLCILAWHLVRRRCLATGSAGRRKKMTLNTALVAPMPSASEDGGDGEARTATEFPSRIAKVGEDGAHGVVLDSPRA